jgi:hypothetical protein
MLTLLCSPKPFRDDAEPNQLNAMRSWRAMDRGVEILVFGNSPGVASAAAEVGATHIPQIECSPSGAPSFNFMAEYAAEHGRFELQIYVNADILVDGNLVSAVKCVAARFPRFLLVGERLDLAEGVLIDVREPGWPSRLGILAKEGRATLHGPTGVDYFGYRRGAWLGLPPVFMGRAMCDQALLHFGFRNRIPVIDGTMAVLAVHQFHGYQHVQGGGREVFQGEDLEAMSVAHGLRRSLPTIADADWSLMADGVSVDRRRHGRRLRQIELMIRYHWGMPHLALAVRALQHLGGKRSLLDRDHSTAAVLLGWRHEGSSAGGLLSTR